MIAAKTLRRLSSCVALALLLLAPASTTEAADTMLMVRNATDPAVAEVAFSEADLLRLPQVTIMTRTEFTDGIVEFVGPLARAALEFIELGDATIVHLVAANDYAFDIPVSYLFEYDVILAMQANGVRLSIRDKGPIWLMYPLDDFEELQDPRYNHRLVWQLTTMELR